MSKYLEERWAWAEFRAGKSDAANGREFGAPPKPHPGYVDDYYEGYHGQPPHVREPRLRAVAEDRARRRLDNDDRVWVRPLVPIKLL